MLYVVFLSTSIFIFQNMQIDDLWFLFLLSIRLDDPHVLNFQGHAFNTFPKMGDTWIPDDIFEMKPLMRNFFENTSLVQVFLLVHWLHFLS